MFLKCIEIAWIATSKIQHLFLLVFLLVLHGICANGVLFLKECWIYSVETVILFWFYPHCPFYVATPWPFSMEFRLIFRDHERVEYVGFLCVLGNAYKMILSFFLQMKPDASFLFGSKLERKLVGSILKERGKGDIHGDKDIGSKQTEPIRIKIFEGG